ncbi:MAG: hypothetical protein LQ342_004849 [Letrouitia transgressa]|nr:MAG: hypothetical protein LQ342_004849 [Letrouitia transgressa]
MFLRCKNIFVFLVFVRSFASTQATVPSPKASTDLTCHTNRASDCYPRIFQPTETFQIVHDDQTLPPGLHVRMNLATGVKEARLNIPESQETDGHSNLALIQSLEYPTIDMDVHALPQKVLQQGSSPRHPLDFASDVGHGSIFSSRVADIKQSATSGDLDILLPSLADLQELSHSYHWGLTLAEDERLVHTLYQFLRSSTISQEVRSRTALLLGTALHNNLPASSAMLIHFYSNEWPEGPLETVITALKHEESPTLASRMIFLLSALCQDRTQLARFVESDGTNLLIRVFDAQSAGRDNKDNLRRKISNFLLDRFLQADSPFPLYEGQSQDIESTVLLERERLACPVTGKSLKYKESPHGSEVHVSKAFLSPWIPTFEASIDAWISNGGNEYAPGAMSSIRETYDKLLDWRSCLVADDTVSNK